MDQSKFFSDIFSNSAMSQALARTNAISSLYRSALPAKLNLEATESIRRSLSFASKIYVPQNNFKNAASALSSYSELINRSSGIASKAFANNLLINSTNTLKNLVPFSNQTELNDIIASATRTNLQTAIAYNQLVKIMTSSFSDTENVIHEPRKPLMKTKKVDNQSYQSTGELKNNEAVFEDEKRNPTKASRNDDISSEDFIDEDIYLAKEFAQMHDEMINDCLPPSVIATTLVSCAWKFAIFIGTVKSAYEGVIWFSKIIIHIASFFPN